jgi:O-antigen ligase
VIVWLGLPRPDGEGVKLERTASIKGRINNWREGGVMFSRYPLLGVGYNALRYARNQPTGNHAGAGWDNSLLVVATTTGVIGLVVFLKFLREVWQPSNWLVKTSGVAIIIHSLFVNSLFFPWVMLWGWIVVGTNPRSSGVSLK